MLGTSCRAPSQRGSRSGIAHTSEVLCNFTTRAPWVYPGCSFLCIFYIYSNTWCWNCSHSSRAWIRTKISRFRVYCPTIRRPGSTPSFGEKLELRKHTNSAILSICQKRSKIPPRSSLNPNGQRGWR